MYNEPTDSTFFLNHAFVVGKDENETAVIISAEALKQRFRDFYDSLVSNLYQSYKKEYGTELRASSGSEFIIHIPNNPEENRKGSATASVITAFYDQDRSKAPKFQESHEVSFFARDFVPALRAAVPALENRQKIMPSSEIHRLLENENGCQVTPDGHMHITCSPLQDGFPKLAQIVADALGIDAANADGDDRAIANALGLAFGEYSPENGDVIVSFDVPLQSVGQNAEPAIGALSIPSITVEWRKDDGSPRSQKPVPLALDIEDAQTLMTDMREAFASGRYYGGGIGDVVYQKATLNDFLKGINDIFSEESAPKIQMIDSKEKGSGVWDFRFAVNSRLFSDNMFLSSAAKEAQRGREAFRYGNSMAGYGIDMTASVKDGKVCNVSLALLKREKGMIEAVSPEGAGVDYSIELLLKHPVSLETEGTSQKQAEELTKELNGWKAPSVMYDVMASALGSHLQETIETIQERKRTEEFQASIFCSPDEAVLYGVKWQKNIGSGTVRIPVCADSIDDFIKLMRRVNAECSTENPVFSEEAMEDFIEYASSNHLQIDTSITADVSFDAKSKTITMGEPVLCVDIISGKPETVEHYALDCDKKWTMSRQAESALKQCETNIQSEFVESMKSRLQGLPVRY